LSFTLLYAALSEKTTIPTSHGLAISYSPRLKHVSRRKDKKGRKGYSSLISLD